MTLQITLTYTGPCFNFIGDGAQLDFDALCDNDNTAMLAFINYLEADDSLGDPGDISDIHWTF
jgi:aryl hydrocarbon receptor nuclear translocator-like protein 2